MASGNIPPLPPQRRESLSEEKEIVFTELLEGRNER